MYAVEVDFRVSFAVDVLQLGDGVGPGVFLLVVLDWVDLNHLIGSLPENVNSRIVVDWHDNSNLDSFLSAVFVGGKLEFWYLEGFGDFTLLADFPRMQKFYLLFFKVWGDDGDVVLVGLDVFDHGLEFVTVDDFGLGDVDNVECGHAKNNCELIIQFS